ncbi:GtrA family protein [Streptomyces sp. enrichment culture]
MGILSSAVAVAGSNVLQLGLPVRPPAAYAIATVPATTVSFRGNRWWTFRHRERRNPIHAYGVFFVLNGVGLLIQLLAIGFAVDVLRRGRLRRLHRVAGHRGCRGLAGPVLQLPEMGVRLAGAEVIAVGGPGGSFGAAPEVRVVGPAPPGPPLGGGQAALSSLGSEASTDWCSRCSWGEGSMPNSFTSDVRSRW